MVVARNLSGYQTYIGPVFEKGQIMFCHDMRHYGYCRKEVKSAHGIETVYMYFNGSGIWGGETLCQCITKLRSFSLILCYTSGYIRNAIKHIHILVIGHYDVTNVFGDPERKS